MDNLCFSYPAVVLDIGVCNEDRLSLRIRYYSMMYLDKEMEREFVSVVDKDHPNFDEIRELRKGDMVWAEPRNKHYIVRTLSFGAKWKRLFSRWIRFDNF